MSCIRLDASRLAGLCGKQTIKALRVSPSACAFRGFPRAYATLASFLFPSLWVDPLRPLVKLGPLCAIFEDR
jgi:hypothetical protein